MNEIKSGVYLLRNKVNGKIYVGKSVNLKKRFGSYKNNETNKCHNQVIDRAIRKYEWKNFEITILEEVLDPILILDREAYWIKFYNCLDKKIGYNICPYGTNTVGIKASEETRKKLSIAGKGKKKNFSKEYRLELRKRITSVTGPGELNPMYGKKHSNETKEKISNILFEMYKNGTLIPPTLGKKLSEETKRKIGENRDYTIHQIKVKQIDMYNGNVIKIWESLQEAAEFLKGNVKRASAICNVCKGRQNTAFGYKWEYAEKENPPVKEDSQPAQSIILENTEGNSALK